MPKQHSDIKQQEMLKRFDSGESASSIAKSMGLFTTSVSRVLKRNGRTFKKFVGENHPSWKGGKHKKYGYIKIWKPTHHRANNIGYVSEHVLVAEEKVGRKISKDEHVHHIDFIRDNNDSKNLWVCSPSQHKKAERSIQKLVKELIEKNIIFFNEDGGKYEIR